MPVEGLPLEVRVRTEAPEKVSVLPAASSSLSWLAGAVLRLNARRPFAAMVVSPPMTPVPPSVALAATETAPLARLWSPLINSVPAETVVGPV